MKEQKTLKCNEPWLEGTPEPIKQWTEQDCLRYEAKRRWERDKFEHYLNIFLLFGAGITVLASVISVFFNR